jgi:hypothetical protein
VVELSLSEFFVESRQDGIEGFVLPVHDVASLAMGEQEESIKSNIESFG